MPMAAMDQKSTAADTLTIAGTDVARIGLGTNRLRSTPENHEFLRDAVESGLGLIDTAHVYTNGDSERAIGAGLTPPPDGVVIATKGGARGTGTSGALRKQIEQSLESLRIDTIGLYYLHRIDPEIPLEESLGAIAKQRGAGRIKDVGISAVDVEQIEAARKVVPIAAVQNQYNLDERGFDEVVDYCEENQIVFVPYYPLKGGGSGALSEVAQRHAATEEQILLAWLLHRSPAMLPIPGTLSIEHLRENLAALDIQLSDEDLAALS